MKYKIKPFLAIILALSIGLQGSVSVFANDNKVKAEANENSEADTEAELEEADEVDELEDYKDSATIFASVMKYIEDNYIGSEVDKQLLLQAALYGMASALDDYSEFFTYEEYEEFAKSLMTDIYTVGLTIDQNEGDYPVVKEVVNNSQAQKSGFQVGDVLLSLNDVDLKNEHVQTVVNNTLLSGETKLKFQIERNKEHLEIETKLEEKKVNTVYLNDINELMGKNYNQDTNVGYIKVSLIADGTSRDFEEAVDKLKLQGRKRLILDLRGNGGGIIDEAFKICDLIVPEGKIVTEKDKEGNVTEIFSELKNPYFEKIVVLVDSTTASAAEMIASALQDSKAGVIVGTKTYGKGVIQTTQPVLDLGVLKMTTLEYFSRNGKKINKVGITPNIEVDVPLFLAENDDIESKKVIDAMKYLGYDASSRIKIMNSIGKIQKDKNLNITRTITKETASEINLMIYQEMNNNDKILAAGYEEINR